MSWPCKAASAVGCHRGSGRVICQGISEFTSSWLYRALAPALVASILGEMAAVLSTQVPSGFALLRLRLYSKCGVSTLPIADKSGFPRCEWY